MPWASFSIRSPRHQPTLPSQITSSYHFPFYSLRLRKIVSLKCFSYTVSDRGLVCVCVCARAHLCICVCVCEVSDCRTRKHLVGKQAALLVPYHLLWLSAQTFVVLLPRN